MKNELQVINECRLKNMLNMDKKENPQKILNILKSEILYVLTNYMEINADDLEVNVIASNEGFYEIIVVGKTKRLKIVSNVIC